MYTLTPNAAASAASSATDSEIAFAGWKASSVCKSWAGVDPTLAQAR